VLIVLVWAQDIVAYFAGTALGRHRLSALISPKKTWEGAIFGLLAGVSVAVAVARSLGLTLVPAYVAGLALVAIGAQLGDLNESLIKRNFAVKDSGGVIPGHGGVLDRFDSFTFAAPLMYYVVKSTT
jgi:phosphatidate cytidylyltransferase